MKQKFIAMCETTGTRPVFTLCHKYNIHSTITLPQFNKLARYEVPTLVESVWVFLKSLNRFKAHISLIKLFENVSTNFIDQYRTSQDAHQHGK